MLPTDLLPKAQQIIERLAAIDYENPKICEQRIQDAFSRHLKALNLPARPVEIYRSFDAAFDAACEVMFFDAAWQTASWAATEAMQEVLRKAVSVAKIDIVADVTWNVALKAALKATKGAFDAASYFPPSSAVEAAREAAFKIAKTASDPVWNVAWKAAFDEAFPWVWRKANKAASNAVEKAASRFAQKAVWGDTNAAFRQKVAEAASWAANKAGYRALAAARNFAGDAVLEAAFDGDHNAARQNIKEAVREAARVVEMVMAVEMVSSRTSSPQYDAAWMPFVDALEAGLFCFWVTTTKVIALTLPVMRIQNARLHADGQPAAQWSDWECYYFWRGTQIPQKYGAVLSREWRSQWLLEESNAELRRVLIQGIGYDRIVQDLKAVELDAWREYSLLKIQADVDLEPIHLLKMTCPSTNHIHVLRVPPNLTSAREAIRWINWDVDPENFAVET